MAQPDNAGNLISRLQLPDSTLAQYGLRASAIPYGQVDSTSTATAFTATVPGINILKDGVCVLLKNGVVTSASGFTINVNGLGAKPSYTNLAEATRDTTIFNVGYTMLFIYDEDRVSGGCWICYRGYDANTNTIGYQLRTNSSTLPAANTGYRYRLWFTSADGAKWVPANTSTSTNSTTSRTPNTTPINPFGPIVYNSTNGSVSANADLPTGTLWQQYTLTVGYSFNEPGGSMTYPAPVYLKCTPQTNGSAVMVELTQALPSTDDGFIYIFLGRAYSATAMELTVDHPVFYNDGTGIRAWTGKKPFSGSYADLTNKPSIPTKTSDLTNDSSFITAAQAPVQSVNGQTGIVTITETDPIFNASVAAGITNTDISNWNKLNNSPQIGYSVSSGIRVSNNVTFHTSGDSDYSDGFVLFHNTTMTNGYFYRLDGSSTGGYQFTNILLDGVGCSFSAVPVNSIYLARMYDNGLWLTSIASKATVTNAINALDGGDIGTGSTTKTITNLSQTDGNVSATFSDIAFPVTSVNTQTGAVVLDADDIDYDSTYTVKGKIDTIIASGGEPNVIETVEVNGTALTVTNKTVDVPVPTSNSSATTGISIADHSTTTITGVSGSTSVTGVQSTTTTASKVTLGTAISVPNVTSVGSASNWVFENITVPIKDSSSKTIPNVTAVGSGSFTQGSFSGGSFEQGTDSFTPNTPTVINTSKFNGGSFTQGTDSFTAATHGSDSFTAAKLNTGFYTAGTAASFTRGTFSGGSFTQGTDSFTANTPTAINTSKFNGGSFTRGSFSGGSFTQGSFSGGSLTITNDTTTDANHHILTFAFSPATHGNDSFTAATHANDSFTPASLASGFYTAGTAASFTQGTDTFTAATHANDSFAANTPTVIDVTKFSGGSFTQGSFNGGSFTQGTDSHTAASLGTGFYTAGTAASFTQGEDEFTPATHGADSHTHTPPTLGTAFTITGVQSTTTTASHVKSGGNGTAPTLGTTISIPNVTAATDVTVPIKNASATTVPTAAATATTVVTSKTHSITDSGHTHTLVVPE